MASSEIQTGLSDTFIQALSNSDLSFVLDCILLCEKVTSLLIYYGSHYFYVLTMSLDTIRYY